MVGFKGCDVMELEFIMFDAIRMVNGYLPKRIQVDLETDSMLIPWNTKPL